jgi:radical SAM superfamily enzyme YgiQ (UPF0313 family)
MRILIVKPWTYNKTIYPPLTLQQLVAITPKEHDVEVISEQNKKIDFNWDGDIVGMSFLTPETYRAYEIADKFRRREKTVILGGWHASALPEEAKQHADSVVIGEGELTWPKLLNDFKKGALKPFYRNNQVVNSNYIPGADRSLVKSGFFMAAVQATRGCPMKCEFCNISNIKYGSEHRMRPIDKVIEEIKTLKHRTLHFYDPSLTTNTRYTKELFKEMKNLNKKFTCFGNINILSRDDELLKLSKEAGCRHWYIGFESIDQNVIKHLGKKSNKVKEYAKSIKKIHDYNLSVIGSFIFGFDSDTKNVFENTRIGIEELSIDVPEITILTPFPGTPLFNRLDREGRILTKDWSKYNTRTGDVIFQPKNVTPEELAEGVKKVTNDLFSYSKIIKRNLKTKNFNHRTIFLNILQHFHYSKPR